MQRFSYRATNDIIAPILQIIFQTSLNAARIPADWTTALVTPIFKKGSRTLPSNYCPVSLTCITSKAFERIIACSIMKHLEKITSFGDSWSRRRDSESVADPSEYSVSHWIKNLGSSRPSHQQPKSHRTLKRTRPFSLIDNALIDNRLTWLSRLTRRDLNADWDLTSDI